MSRVMGGSQVRERVVFEAVMFSEPTAERRPIQSGNKYRLDTETRGHKLFMNMRAPGCSAPSVQLISLQMERQWP